MNLTMDKEVIESLGERGRSAAARLVEAYAQPDDSADRVITWDNHRWVRLRSSLCVLEEMHERFVAGFDGAPENGERTYVELIERKEDELPKSYPWAGSSQMDVATAEIAGIRSASEKGGASGSVTDEAPSPTPIGRILPRD